MDPLQGSSKKKTWTLLDDGSPILFDTLNTPRRQSWSRPSMSNFCGSSASNPWVMDPEGNLVLHGPVTMQATGLTGEGSLKSKGRKRYMHGPGAVPNDPPPRPHIRDALWDFDHDWANLQPDRQMCIAHNQGNTISRNWRPTEKKASGATVLDFRFFCRYATEDSYWAEDLATNLARESSLFSYQLRDDSLESQPDEPMEDGINLVPSTPPPRNPYSVMVEPKTMPVVQALCAPIELGVWVQLGHPPGIVCPYRQAAAHDIVLYNASSMHELSVDFCSCRTGPNEAKPPTEHRIQVVARLLVACNNNSTQHMHDIWSPATVPDSESFGKADRRKPFMHIMHQWRKIKCLKGGKQGHSDAGCQGDRARRVDRGMLSVPAAGMEVTGGLGEGDGWGEVDHRLVIQTVAGYSWNLKFLYFLFLAQDANFRLSNCMVSSELGDPILGDGWGYFRKQYRDDGYHAHSAKHANEEELSNCSGFSMMSQANTKRTKGLRTRYATRFWEHVKKFPKHKELAMAEVDVWWKSYENPSALAAGLTDRVLPKRLAVAILEGTVHSVSLKAFTSGLEGVRPGQVKEWMALVDIWESKQHTTPNDSLFELLEEVTTAEVEKEHSAGQFLPMVIEIERTQHNLAVDSRALKDPSPNQKLGSIKRRTELLKHIQKFRGLQGVYMSTVRQELSAAQKLIFDKTTLRFAPVFVSAGSVGHGYGFGYKTVNLDPDPENPNPNPNPRVHGLSTGCPN
ncbi:hypothetical protein K438DRAFT_2128227 [Mycena galopus ATCC 62051]|nr:hypothetical protein K438DRAFT_2128227 [Mycena galopus ATCC 62051]